MNPKSLLSGAALSALIYGAAFSYAHAANSALILWNGANPGDAETATGTGSADLLGSSLDGINVSASSVTRETNPNGITESNFNITNTTGTVQVLHIIGGVNGLLGPSTDFTLSATILVALGQATLGGSFFADQSNSLNGMTESVTGTDVGDFLSTLLTGPHAFSFNSTGADSVTGTYGLAENLTLTLQPFAQIGVQSISMDANAVPEPKTWALLGLGFGLMAFLGVKRRRNRLAVAV